MKYNTLYKRAVNGKVSTWYVEVKDNCFRTVSGYIDGEKVTSAWTCCDAKNIGKANATTPEQQADAEAIAMFTKRKALGYYEDIKDIDKPMFFEPMLAKDWDKERLKVKFPLYSQPKLDGMRCIVKSDGMWSRNGKQVISAPHIFNALEPLFEEYPDIVLDGELYAERSEIDFNTIISCVRKTKPNLEDYMISKQYIRYHVYDCGSHPEGFIKRYKFLYEEIKLHEYDFIVPVETNFVRSHQEVMQLYKDYVNRGYEGQMLRVLDAPYENKRSKYLLKHKSWVENEFEIKGVVEGKGNLSGKVGKLQFELNGKPFDSAVNGGWEYLEQLFKRKDLIGKPATVKYFELTEDGVPRFPKVVEIRDYE